MPNAWLLNCCNLSIFLLLTSLVASIGYLNHLSAHQQDVMKSCSSLTGWRGWSNHTHFHWIEFSLLLSWCCILEMYWIDNSCCKLISMQSIDVIWWLRYGRHSHPQVTENFLSSFGHQPACYVDLDMMTVMVLVVLMVWALVGTVAILMYLTRPPMGINAAVFIKELIRRMFGAPPCSYW